MVVYLFRAILNLMKANPYLVEVDRLLVRSWMFLISLDELVECRVIIHVELLDMLQLFILKAPADISYSSSTVSVKILLYEDGNGTIIQ